MVEAARHVRVNAATVRNKNDALSIPRILDSVVCLCFRTNSNFSFFVSGRDGRDGKPGE